ncbi:MULTISPECIES: tetratricopeptide repeat protein [Aeromonas]|uniref:tetratricopeptide repeat protein n=1 Tax=Aeromonas TaxID=642 RepID=UPI00191F4ACF|nr:MULTISPECIES: tetratricopeptide repeat protein [Aeromonas]MBL0465293.1 sel1 repeat family protein [Aeromonas veronii]QXB02939.1 sel1 repeat family protein [Aeromonas sp. FDAARGOS 1416]
MSPTTSRWLFIGLLALVIWRLLPLSTEQEMAAANRAWRTGHFDEATRIWSPLAAQGQPRAQALMGWSHEVGQGSEQDIHQAISLYRQSALAGDPFGQYRLAELYLRGVGVKRDLRQAFHWMDQAARNGDVPAMLKVGVLHLMGVSGRVDLPQAKQWLYQAAQKGNKLALQVLQELALAEEGSSDFDFNWQSLLGE